VRPSDGAARPYSSRASPYRISAGEA
jgi:hypothetical protein